MRAAPHPPAPIPAPTPTCVCVPTPTRPLPPPTTHPAPCSYPSDDINKFLWMVRIGGGVFPEIKEPHYLGADGGHGEGHLGGGACGRGCRTDVSTALFGCRP